MIAVDTNILVYAHREDVVFHDAAYRAVKQLAESNESWAIPWPCLHEFLAIVTHPRVYDPPTPVATALDQVEAWLRSPSLVLLSEADGHWDMLRSLVIGGSIQGPRFHDARIATLCRTHGVSELWSADRDFGRFPEFPVRNPLVGLPPRS